MIAQLLVWVVPAAIYGGLALALSLAGLLQFRLVARVAPERRIAVALIAIGLGALATVAMTSRNLDESGAAADHLMLYEDYAGGFAASRWMTLLLLGASIVEIVRGAMQRRGTVEADPAWPLMAAMVAFYGGTLVIQTSMSEHPGFVRGELYVPIFFLALCYQRVTDPMRILGAAKLTILALTASSLAAIAIRPDAVLHRPYVGMIPGIDWRLFGLTPHANTLGPIALLGLILELHTPSRRVWFRWLGLAASMAVLVLAQSRTAWIAGLFVAAIVCLPLEMAKAASQAGDARAFRRAVWAVLTCIAVLIGLVGVLTLSAGYLQSKADLGTLNGRFAIWDITLEAWRENVLFGYGPEVWGAERRLRFHLFHVGQAHNQLLQTLGEAGLAGLLLLVVYLGTLVIVAWQRFVPSRGLILALLVLLVTRCVTEAPMRAEGLLSWATFLHALLLVVACHQMRLSQPASRRARSVWAARPELRPATSQMPQPGAGAA